MIGTNGDSAPETAETPLKSASGNQKSAKRDVAEKFV